MSSKKKTASPAPAPKAAPVPAPEEAPKAAPAPAPEEAPKAAPAPVRSGGGMVAVACNLPQGVSFIMPKGRLLSIGGNAEHLRGKEMGVLPVGAYGITMVSESDWEYVKKTYGHMGMFRKGLIFARDKKADAEAQAEEQAETRHGFEPVDPERTATEPAGKTEG